MLELSVGEGGPPPSRNLLLNGIIPGEIFKRFVASDRNDPQGNLIVGQPPGQDHPAVQPPQLTV